MTGVVTYIKYYQQSHVLFKFMVKLKWFLSEMIPPLKIGRFYCAK